MTVFECLNAPDVQEVLKPLPYEEQGELITMLLYSGVPVTPEAVREFLKRDTSYDGVLETERYNAAKLACMMYLAKKQIEMETMKQKEIIRQYQK